MLAVIRAALRAALVLALSLLMSSAVAASAAADGGEAADAAFHIGVRTIEVGAPIPVTVVGAEPGSAWEIREQSTAALLGMLTVGEDGTGTATVSLPLDTDLGSAELVAVHGDVELSSSASVGSSTTQGAAPPVAVEEGAPLPPAAVAAIAVFGAVALIAAALLVIARRAASRTQSNPGMQSKEIAS